ncbi:MAG: TauD/TfdA family dioxygenase [Hyphomicrobium sp.]|jgi:hypothetical protein
MPIVDKKWPICDVVPDSLAERWRRQQGWRGDGLAKRDWLVELPAGFAEVVHETVADRSDASAAAQRLSDHAFVMQLRLDVEQRLEGGHGFCVLRGIPPTSDDRLNARVALAVSLLFGQPVTQTLQGDIVARVEDRTGRTLEPTKRGHTTSAELAFHADRADRVLLYCVRPSRSGGESSVVSSVFLRDEMRREVPHLLEALAQPLPEDRRGEQPAHEPPFALIPVFSDCGGVFVCRYIRRFLQDSCRHAGAPPLSETAVEALNYLDALTAREGVAFSHRLEAGDLQMLNNCVVLHSRTAFVDDPLAPRLLLRTWLSHRSSRPLPPSFAPLYGSTEAGAVRGGVQQKS